jgi:hypothetical protein
MQTIVPCRANGQLCTQSASFPSLFEVPVWPLKDDEAGRSYWMDPLFTDYVNWQPSEPHRLQHVLKSNFDAAYNGNRAPFPLYLHAYWHSAANFSAILGEFIHQVAAMPDVYFVTMRQLLGWMQRPVSAQDLRKDPAKLGCGTPGGGTLLM